jgi:hypothetical protein
MPVPLLCKPGLEGIVQSDRATGMAGHPDWFKFKNPDGPALKGEAEEDAMPHPVRPTGLGSGIDKDRSDYAVY